VTKKAHRGLLAPRRPRTITTYLGGLDNSRDEILPRYHREAAADDPWLSPLKSEAVMALTILIAHAQSHTLNTTTATNLDLRGFCEDAELTERQTEVVVLTGEGWSQRAIGAWLHISQPVVCRHLSIARHALAGRLPQVVSQRLTEFDGIA
jgi:DNA-binding NarL/FixJ family response regulator